MGRGEEIGKIAVKPISFFVFLLLEAAWANTM